MAKAEKINILSPRSLFQLVAKEKLPPFILFINCKGGLFQKTIERLREELLGPNWKVNYTEIEGKDASYSELTGMLLTTPFMAKRRMVVVKEAEEFWKSLGKEKERLAEFLSSYGGKNLLVIAANGDLNLSSFKTKTHPFAKVAASKGVIVTMKPRNREELRQWVLREIKKAGLEPDPAFVEWLVEESEGNVGFIENEIAKRALYAEEEEEFKTAVSLNRFKGEIGRGDIKAIKSLEELLAAGYSPLYLMGVMTNMVRNAVAVYEEAKKARSLQAGLQKARIYPGEREAIVSLLKRHPKGRIYKLFSALQDADRELKSSSTPPQVVLNRVIISL